jgi:hypothetical protein
MLHAAASVNSPASEQPGLDELVRTELIALQRRNPNFDRQIDWPALIAAVDRQDTAAILSITRSA